VGTRQCSGSHEESLLVLKRGATEGRGGKKRQGGGTLEEGEAMWFASKKKGLHYATAREMKRYHIPEGKDQLRRGVKKHVCARRTVEQGNAKTTASIAGKEILPS